MFALQVILAPLPNIEVVSLLIIVFSLSLDKSVTIAAIYIFVLFEGLMYGFGIWWYTYLYIWTFLAIYCFIFKRIKDVHFWAISSMIYGFLFGALCAFPTLFTKGWSAGLSFWISGIYFDIIHGFGNFAVCLYLYPPLTVAMNACKKISTKYIKI